MLWLARKTFLGHVPFYRTKDGTRKKVFDALEWLAAMCSHIPDRGKQMVRYFGCYSNVSRGEGEKTEDDAVPCILEADKSSKEYRKNWARLIQKIYEINPLICQITFQNSSFSAPSLFPGAIFE